MVERDGGVGLGDTMDVEGDAWAIQNGSYGEKRMMIENL